MKNFILGILTVLIIGGVAFFAYWAGQKNYFTKEKISVSPTVVPSPTVSTTIVSPTAKPTENNVSDNELIKKALFDKNGWKETDGITVTISTNDGKYASGGAAAQGGGGYFFAVKENGEWVIVADGNGTISCESLKPYPDFPKTLIPECWDEVNQKNVKR